MKAKLVAVAVIMAVLLALVQPVWKAVRIKKIELLSPASIESKALGVSADFVLEIPHLPRNFWIDDDARSE